MSKHKTYAEELIQQAICDDIHEQKQDAQRAIRDRRRESVKALGQFADLIAVASLVIVIAVPVFMLSPIWLFVFGVVALPYLLWIAVIAIGVRIGTPRK